MQSLERLAGDPQGQLQRFRLWSTCNLWLCLLITPTEILHLHCVPEHFVLAAWTLLFSYQRIILYYVISLFQFMSASQQFQGVNFQGLWFSHHCKVRGFGFMLVLFFSATVWKFTNKTTYTTHLLAVVCSVRRFVTFVDWSQVDQRKALKKSQRVYALPQSERADQLS